MQQIYTKSNILDAFKVRPIDQLSIEFQQLCQSQPAIFKPFSFQPSPQKQVKGYNQEILVYSSNQTTPLRTAGIQQQNQFLFEDNKLLTPQPTHNRNFDFTQKKELLFIFSRPGLLNNLNAKIWYYIDDFSKIQGPFSTIQMENWYQKGIFDEIRRVGNLLDQTEFYPRIHQLKGPIKKQDKIIIKSLLRVSSCPKKIDNYENKVVVVEKQYAEVPNIRIPQPKKKEMKK